MNALSGFLQSPEVQTALVVGGLVALATAIVGVFTVVRGQAFAGHALADLGAVGGSGAFLVGLNQVVGFVGAGVLAALVIEFVGLRRMKGSDIATGIVFSAGLGIAALFLYFDTTIGGSSNAAVAVLFGSLFVIDPAVVPLVVVLAVAALLIVTAIGRWLLLDSLDRGLAIARGVPVRLAGALFLLALALAVELSALTIGAILSTALLIAPAATAIRCTSRIATTIPVAAGVALTATWAGCLLSYLSDTWAGGAGDWPVSFCIVALLFLGFLAARAWSALRARHPRAHEAGRRADRAAA